MVDLLSVAEAAKRLTAAGDKIDRSGLSRYLTRHAAALPTTKESGRLTLVDYDALKAHRRAHLGKNLAAGAVAVAGLSRADEQQGKLRADRMLAIDRLAKRRADLVPIWAAERIAVESTIALRRALHDATAEIAAMISAERGGDVDRIRSVLADHDRQADAIMVSTLKGAGFLVTSVAELHRKAALVSPDEPEPLEPQNLDEERAAKARMDRLRQELTLAQKRRAVITHEEAEFAFADALQQAKQALATAARDGIEALARAAGVEPVFVRSYPRQHERRVLVLFAVHLWARFGGRP